MRIAFAADHAGYELKDELITRLAPLGHELIDLGGDGSSPEDDYPDFARALGLAILEGRADRGILVCGSGVGASIAASKLPGIRAGLCHDTYSAGQGVEHDDMNVLALGARVIGVETAVTCAESFLAARFSGAPRHVRRVGKIRAIEQEAARMESAKPGSYSR
ncbi:MAG: RpiB/LacA/LacB family sugar-phosphate isomerase [Candidatus Limnocylindrales bacterium]|jgi:ribose 5-phosphate isomerase B